MHFLKKFTRMNSEDAVSPVIGVMLMLVVTIIIAAVVSAFSGGLIGGTDQKAPTLTMDIKISNTGSWSGSGFTATVTSVSAPIHTKNLKIVTSWKTGGKTGGATSQPLGHSVQVPVKSDWGEVGETQIVNSNAPYGYGPGVNGTAGAQSHTNPFAQPDQQFGNYTFVQGTGLVALPYGGYHAMIPASQDQVDGGGGYGVIDAYKYTVGGKFTSGTKDAAQAVLGDKWEDLRVGDTVNVKVVHIPTGKVILEKNVAVTEG